MEIRNLTAGLASHIVDTVSQHKFGSDQNISEKEKILLGLFFIALSLRYVKHSTIKPKELSLNRL